MRVDGSVFDKLKSLVYTCRNTVFVQDMLCVSTLIGTVPPVNTRECVTVNVLTYDSQKKPLTKRSWVVELYIYIVFST